MRWWKGEGWRPDGECGVGGNVIQGDNKEFEVGSGLGNEEWANDAVRRRVLNHVEYYWV